MVFYQDQFLYFQIWLRVEDQVEFVDYHYYVIYLNTCSRNHPFKENDLKNKILVHNGIIPEESAAAQRKPSVVSCARCSLVNAVDNKFCSKCSYPLTPQAYEEIKAEEDEKFKAI
jgi:hypothetical protein